MGKDSSVECVLCVGQGAPVDATTRQIVAAEAPDLIQQLAQLGLDNCFELATTSTAYAQPAIYSATVAGWRRLDGAGFPNFAAGHSLGEYAALVIAGALDTLDGLRLVSLRGRLMQQAAESYAPNGMLAVRAGVDDVEDVLHTVPGITIANDNAARQIVLAGELAGLDRVAQELRARGLRSTRLRVSGAFHHPLMMSVIDEMNHALERVDFDVPKITVMSGLTGRPFENIRTELLAGITSRVRWREVMQRLVDSGVTRFVDVGPGRVLGKLASKIAPNAEHTGLV